MNEDRAANAGDDCDDRDPEKYILLGLVLIVVSVRSFEKPNESKLGGKRESLNRQLSAESPNRHWVWVGLVLTGGIQSLTTSPKKNCLDQKEGSADWREGRFTEKVYSVKKILDENKTDFIFSLRLYVVLP